MTAATLAGTYNDGLYFRALSNPEGLRCARLVRRHDGATAIEYAFAGGADRSRHRRFAALDESSVQFLLNASSSGLAKAGSKSSGGGGLPLGDLLAVEASGVDDALERVAVRAEPTRSSTTTTPRCSTPSTGIRTGPLRQPHEYQSNLGAISRPIRS